MASKKCSPTSSSTNSYFFYGTHPIQVPDHHSHSSLSSDIAQHFPLPLANRNGRVMTTSQSLNDDEEEMETFEDARDYSNDDTNPTSSNRLSSGESTLTDWNQAFQECDQINKLVFQNYMEKALELTSAQKNRSLYHSLCHSTINYIKAVMTFDPEDIETTVQATRNTIQMAKKFEQSKSWMTFNWLSKTEMNEYELHAKLVYAEAVLIGALLSFAQDQGLLGFINAGFKLKECNNIYVKLSKENDRTRFSSPVSYANFDSGVRMGNGTFNLMISNLPQRIIRYLEFVGFSGDRELGLAELEKSATSLGLRSTFSSLYLLTYHTFVLQLFGNAEGDLDLCDTLVERNLQIYPNSYIFLFYKAKLQEIRHQLDPATETFQYAMQCQQDWKNLHHIAFWELFWCHALKREWKEAATMAERLYNENNWSKATYCYLLSTCIFETNNGTANERVRDLYKRVPGLKIRLAGKSIPLEKYAIKQCDRFHTQDWLFLPGLEIIYLMNGFYILARDQEKLDTTLGLVDSALENLISHRQSDKFYADSYGSGLLLRGVLLHFLQRFDEAHRSFDEILNMKKKFEKGSLLPANACLEKALIYLTQKESRNAHEYLRNALRDYKDYQLESRLQFRVNAALQTVKRMKTN